MEKRLAIRMAASFGGAAVVLAAAPIAAAQERVPVAIGSSERAAFQAQGLPVGGFRIYPSLRLSTGYDDNVLIGGAHDQGDGFVTLAPTAEARSQWTTHALNLRTFLRENRYFRRHQQNNEEYGAFTDGRLDVSRGMTIGGSADYSRTVEVRGTPGDLISIDTLIPVSTTNASLQTTNRFNRVLLTISGSTSRYRYGNISDGGVLINQAFRNRDGYSASARVSYQYSPQTQLFVSGSYNAINYARVGTGSVDRSSQGGSALVGVEFEITRLLRGEAGVGYLVQRFDDSRYRDLNGVNYNVSLAYDPTVLTSLRLTASRQLTDSAIAQVSGVLASRVNLTGEHELLRNVLVNIDAGYTYYEFRGLDTGYGRWDAGVGVRYKFAQFLSAALSFDRISQSGSPLFSAYDSNRVSLSLIAAR